VTRARGSQAVAMPSQGRRIYGRWAMQLACILRLRQAYVLLVPAVAVLAFWCRSERFYDRAHASTAFGTLIVEMDDGECRVHLTLDRLPEAFHWYSRGSGLDHSLRLAAIGRRSFALGVTTGSPAGRWRRGGRSILSGAVPHWLPIGIATVLFAAGSVRRLTHRRRPTRGFEALVGGTRDAETQMKGR
jgi:hypothetical protein